jgi:hypothetical protein
VQRNGRSLLAAVCFLALLMSAGCAVTSSPTAKQETLEERVRSYMQAQIDKKWDRAYSFFDSSFRGRVTRESYIATPRKITYTGYVIDEITVLPAGDQATVQVKIDIMVMGFDFKRGPQTQSWIKEKGEWFVKAEPPSRKTPFTPEEKRQ